MALFNFKKSASKTTGTAMGADARALIAGYSIEVMPRTAAKIDSFADILPKGTRVYIAHIDGTPIEDMIATAKRIAHEGFAVMPHIPARSVPSRDALNDWIARYQGEADVRQALLLAGGIAQARGPFDNSMDLIESGVFDANGFERLHVAGHPEGSRDIDPAGGRANVDAALAFKQAYAERTDADMAIVTQFAFEAAPLIAWAESLAQAGITMPIHLGLAAPAKLQTLITFAMSCGVGPSLKVLQKRAMDVSKLLLPYTPDTILADLAAYKAANPQSLIEGVHFFPLGGIKTATTWTAEHGHGPALAPASRAASAR